MSPRELGFRVCRAFAEGDLKEGERLSRQFVLSTTPDHRRLIMRQWVSHHGQKFPGYSETLLARLEVKEPEPPCTEKMGWGTYV